MPLSYTTVTGTFTDGSGSPVGSASATFTPSAVVLDTGLPVVTPAAPVSAQIKNGQLLNEAGGPLTLLATDNAGLSVQGLTGFWYWNVTVHYTGSDAESWSFFLPASPSATDIAKLINSPAGGFTSPMTALGDLIYENATPAPARLAGPTTAGTWLLTSTPSAGVAQAPAWAQGVTLSGYLAPAVVTLTDAASITLDASKGNSFAVTLTASGHTLANPANPVDGQAIRVRVIQDATGGRTIAYGTAYDFGAAGAPILSTGANKVDILGFEYVASLAKWCYLGSGLGF